MNAMAWEIVAGRSRLRDPRRQRRSLLCAETLPRLRCCWCCCSCSSCCCSCWCGRRRRRDRRAARREVEDRRVALAAAAAAAAAAGSRERLLLAPPAGCLSVARRASPGRHPLPRAAGLSSLLAALGHRARSTALAASCSLAACWLLTARCSLLRLRLSLLLLFLSPRQVAARRAASRFGIARRQRGSD